MSAAWVNNHTAGWRLSPGPKELWCPLPVLRTKVTRRRAVPFKAPSAYRNDHGFIGCGPSMDGVIYPTTFGRIDYSRWQGVQTTTSESHPGWRDSVREPLFRGDVGGEFRTERTWVTSDEIIPVGLYGLRDASPPATCKQWGRYNGPILPISPSVWNSFPATSASSPSTLAVRGTTAIARCKPTNPSANVSVMLGEFLHEGIPKIAGGALSGAWRNQTSKAKAAGSEYLNVEFGWEPLVQDMSDFAHAISRAEKLLKQFERDAGRMVRRRYAFPVVKSTTYSTPATGVNAFANATGQVASVDSINQGSVVRVRKETQRQWFSGAFVYHLPTGYNSRSELARITLEARQLFGLSLTPDTIWNLAPWSWAVDWMVNAGDVISNVSDFLVDGLVLKYGYMMEHTLVSETYSFVGPTGFQSADVRPPTVTLNHEVKQRVRATPYGFGLTWAGFTARQLAILAAIGITRS